MGTFYFSLKMLKKEVRESIIYMMILTLTIAIAFLFFNIIDHSYLMKQFDQDIINAQNIHFSSVLSLIVIAFCAFMIIFANNFYISKKTKEIAIMTMSGSRFIDITLYLFYQNIVMSLVAFLLGSFLGSLLAIGVNNCIYQYLSYSIPFFYLPIQAYWHTLYCLLAIIIAQLIYASGFVYRKDISYMLTQEKKNSKEDIRLIRFPSFIYIGLYCFGLVMLLSAKFSIGGVLTACGISLLGLSGIIKYYLEKFLLSLKRRKYMKNHLKIISLSHLYYSLRRSVLLMMLYDFFGCLMICVLTICQNNPREWIVSIIGFIVILFLLLASLIYRYLMEVNMRKSAFHHLYKMGYSYTQLVKIIQQEILYYYLFFIGLPLIFMIVIFLKAFQYMTISMIIGTLGGQILLIIVATWLTYIFYKKSALYFLIKEKKEYE